MPSLTSFCCLNPGRKPQAGTFPTVKSPSEDPAPQPIIPSPKTMAPLLWGWMKQSARCTRSGWGPTRLTLHPIQCVAVGPQLGPHLTFCWASWLHFDPRGLATGFGGPQWIRMSEPMLRPVIPAPAIKSLEPVHKVCFTTSLNIISGLQVSQGMGVTFIVQLSSTHVC